MLPLNQKKVISLDDIDGFLCESISLRRGGKFNTDLQKSSFELVKVLLTTKRWTIKPQNQVPQRVKHVGRGGHRRRRDLLLRVVRAWAVEPELVEEGPGLAAQL